MSTESIDTNTNRYQNGKIYKIYVRGSNLCYIGSTCGLLNKRMANHRAKYKQYQAGKLKAKLSVFEVLAVEGARIELIEDYPCQRKDQLMMREGYWVQNIDCVNKQTPGAYAAAGGKIEYDRKYRQDNSAEIKAKQAKKISCPQCNCEITGRHIPQHKRSKKHISNSASTSTSSSASGSIINPLERLIISYSNSDSDDNSGDDSSNGECFYNRYVEDHKRIDNCSCADCS